jgi:2-keto-3-deoxy-L-rhamnonate aldolase RhmA
MRSIVPVLAALVVTVGPAAAQTHNNVVIDLWMQGKAAFGVYAPDENPRPPRPEAGAPPAGAPGAGAPGQPGGMARGPRPKPLYTAAGAEKLAANPLYDYVFLNLEDNYDPEAVRVMARGLRSPAAVGRKMLIVRIPPIEHDGADATKARVKEILDAGADGVTIPHVRNVEEATLALTFFTDAKADVWSPSNVKGEKIAMLMLEDPGAVAQRRQVAELKGLSILACGIGSLTQALKGDRAGAETGTQQILEETRRVKLVNMLTANTQDVEKRVKEGFLALLMNGPTADDAIRIGRTAAGRQ